MGYDPVNVYPVDDARDLLDAQEFGDSEPMIPFAPKAKRAVFCHMNTNFISG